MPARAAPAPAARAGPLRTRVPEAEPLQQHPDPLAPLRHAVETAVQVEVLERGQLAVEEWLVAEIPQGPPIDVALGLSRRRSSQPGAETEERRLPGPVRAGDDEQPAALELEVEDFEDALVAEASPEPASADHDASASSAC